MPIELTIVQEKIEAWVEGFVVKLNLCPFAKRELLAERVRYVVVDATTEAELLVKLEDELVYLQANNSTETTLVIHPYVLADFYQFNEFLEDVDELLATKQLEGVFQVASFHPNYQFAGTVPEDVENFTNRSPYPVLHLLREESLARAIAHHSDPDSIPEHNVELLKGLGLERVQALLNNLRR